jgi:glycosyltransferase A (GT-A) superfamily protein (DUF2064 family)
VKPAVVRLTAALVAIAALAGCGARRVAEQPAPNPQRTQDLVPLTTRQAARLAVRVAVVEAGRSTVVEGAPGTPFTRTAFAVRSVLKGRLPARFVLQVVGGRLGDRIVESPAPAFAPGRRYVLFLGPDGPAGPTIIPQVVLDAAPGVVAAVRRDLR